MTLTVQLQGYQQNYTLFLGSEYSLGLLQTRDLVNKTWLDVNAAMALWLKLQCAFGSVGLQSC